jgi:hypothetical protein
VSGSCIAFLQNIVVALMHHLNTIIMKKNIIVLLVFLFINYASFTQVIRAIRPAVASSSSCCGFSATNTPAIPMAAKFGKENVIAFDKENFDDGNAYDGAFYTAPSDGVYQFNITITLKAKNTSTGTEQIMLILKAGSMQTSQIINVAGGYDNVITDAVTGVYKLTTGEKASVVLIGLGGNTTAATTGNSSIFSGVKLY